MRGPLRRINYDRKLTRPIKLADGTRLKTLKDAADVLADRFTTATKWDTLEFAIERLITAGESGNRDDIAKATEQVEIVLRERPLLYVDAMRRDQSTPRARDQPTFDAPSNCPARAGPQVRKVSYIVGKSNAWFPPNCRELIE